ncbi:hypothetical protein lerEdw1_002718 [Lerista edwardsae]|nr:hypothetical protein lerEdw1_002718 [Lerista edwardsae]
MLAQRSACADEDRLRPGLVRGASMGEAQQAYAVSEAEPGARDKDAPFEPPAKKDVGDFERGLPGGSEAGLPSGTEQGPLFAGLKDKEPHSQREAVIRPQQAGKIDFKSLHSRPRFPGDGPWGPAKGSPQSPSGGKGRAREKGRRAGKGERGHQQLYRLTISSARPSPTIGIAYPQQKVTPPKAVDAGRGPVSGSYRFHVPSLPEREAELQQQEELGFARCLPEAPSGPLPSNYTSAAAAARPAHGAKLQPAAGGLHESPSGQLPYPEFPGHGSGCWPLPDKSLPGAHGGLPASRPCPFPESSKPSVHCLGPLPCQYPFPPLRGSAADPFQGEAGAQDYADASLAASQASRGALAFHASSRDWKEEALGGGPYGDHVGPEGRAYGLAPPPGQFLPSQAPGPSPGYRGRREQATDAPHGALSPPGAIDQALSTFQEGHTGFPHGLHVPSLPKPTGRQRQPPCKDSVAGPPRLDPGSSLRRTLPALSLAQVHFQTKPYTEPPAGSPSPGGAPFEKSLPATAQPHPRLLQAWEGGKRPFSPLEAGPTPHLSPAGGQLAFGCPLGLELRQPRKKPWPLPHLTPAMPGQSRVELPRRLPFQLGAPEWDGGSKASKGGAGYPGKALLTGEGAIIQRHDPGALSSASTFRFDSPADAEPLPKALYFSLGQAGPPAPARLPSGSAPALPSPSSSPLPSPAPNPAGSSTCSSLSPLSCSPPGHSFEDSVTLASPPYFHPPKDGHKPFHASEPPGASALHCQAADPIRPFQLSQDAPKEKVFYRGLAADSHFHRPAPEGFEAELPPPPYSSHHLLASSLSSASLDQLDVFLTCKQCDQNFSTLPAFLEHRQFCSPHTALQGPAKDASRGPDVRRQHAGQGLLLPPQDAHLLPLNKTTLDFLADGEGKGEAKEDPLKGAQLGSLAPNPPPLSASDLDIDEAKLDSLITEALNGLEYQSDTPEIDSSFIDVFADEELGGTPHKAKEGLVAGKKAKHWAGEESARAPGCCEEHPGGDLTQSRLSGKQHGHRDGGAGWLPPHGDKWLERPHSPELLPSEAVDPGTYERVHAEASGPLKACRKKTRGGSFSPFRQAARAPLDMRQPTSAQRAESAAGRLGPGAAGDPKPSARGSKKRQLRSGTWSKELIHKIVQQKNQLHKRHRRSSKGVPLPLPPARPLPEAKDSRFGEYEYVSESDEERVEHAKQHCRRKLGARLPGRPRGGFGSRGRGKEPEPAWRYGQRRGREEPQRGAGTDPGWREDCGARVRRRSSRSSTSSRQSTSETSPSPPSTERADSDLEKESEQRRRRRQSPRPVGPRLNVPRQGPAGRGHDRASDSPRVDSAVIPPARGSPGPSPIRYPQGVEGPPQTPGGSPRSQGLLGKAPATPACAEDAEQHRGSGQAKAAPQELDPCALRVHPPWRQFAAPAGEALGFPVEDFISPSPSTGSHNVPSDVSPGHGKRGPKFLRKQDEVPPPISCFSDNLVGLRMAERRTHPLVNAANPFYDCSELPSGYESPALFSGAPATAPPPSANSMYFCQENTGLGSCKPKPPEIPPSYDASSEHRKASLPLSFDSSPVFGELPMAEFDTTLYEGHQLGKMTPFDQHYSSFLHEKDWNVMEEMPSVVPDDIAPFQNLSVEKPLARKYSAVGGQMPLPGRMPSYAAPFPSGLSDDELEIKRLVTELESQLQSSKPDTEASPEDQAPKLPASLDRKGASGQFSPLSLDPESDGKDLFLIEIEFENSSLVSPKACICEDPANEKALLPALDGSHRDPWPCAGPYSPLQSSAEELLLGGPFSSKEAHEKLHETLKEADIPREGSFREIPNAPAGRAPESGLADNREAPSYADSLIRSPDPLFPKTLEGAELNLHETLPARANAFPELQQKETLFEDPAGLEPFSHPTPRGVKRELELQAPEAESSLPSRTPNSKAPEEESLFCKATSPETLEGRTPFQEDRDRPALLEEVEEAGLVSPAGRTPALRNQAGEGDPLLLDALAFSKETGRSVDCAPAPQVKGANPLQQLQLFVARTVKHNEEDLLMPCFPALHSSAHLPLRAHVQPEHGGEATDSMPSGNVADRPAFQEGEGSTGEEPESVAKASNTTEPFLEPRLGEKVSEPAGLQGSGLRQTVTAPQHFKAACSELAADGAPPAHGPLSPRSNSLVTSLPREKGVGGTRVTEEVDGEPRTATLAFESRQNSPLSTGSFEKEAPACALPAALRIHAAGCAPWGEALCEGQGAGTVSAHQAAEFGPLQCNPSLGPTNPPENQPQDDFLLRQTSLDEPASRQLDVTQDSFPAEADPKCTQDHDTGEEAGADARAQRSEEARGLPSGEDQPVPQDSAKAEGAVVGDSTQRPSKQKEWEEAVPFAPEGQCCGDSTNLPSNAIGGQQQHLVEDTPNDLTELQSDIPPPSATSRLSGDPAAALLDREGGLKFQNINSPSMSPFKPGDLSEGPPKSPVREDGETCPVREATSSPPLDYLQGILLGQSPSGTDSAPLTDARTSTDSTYGCKDVCTNAELTLNPQGAREVESGPQKRSEDQTLPETCRKNAGLQEVPAISLVAAANSAGVHLCTSPSPETTEMGPPTASPGSDRESQDSQQRGTVRRVSSCLEPADSKSERRRRNSKNRQLRDKDGKVLPVTCEVCAVPFRSKTGLMRHRTVKHPQKAGGPLLLDPGSAPGETSKRAARKSRKGLKGTASRSRKSSPATDRPLPKPCRSPRKGSGAGMQEAISRGLLGDLGETSFALQSPTQPGQEARPGPARAQAAGVEVAAPEPGRGPRSRVRVSDPSAGGTGSLAKRKVQRKVRKGRRKGGPSPSQAPGASSLEDKRLEAGSQATPSAATCIPSAELEGSSTAAGDQAHGPLPSPPADQAPKGAAAAAGGSSAEGTAGPQPLQGGGSWEGQRERPGPGGRRPTPEPNGSPEQAEEEHEVEPAGSPSEEASREESGRPLSCTASPSRLQPPPCGAPAEVKDSPRASAAGGVPCPADSTPWKTGPLGPRSVPCGEGAAGPDLQGLLDDDATFSQLFPPNDQFARRKGTRVYGKRSKRPRPAAEVSARPEGAADPFTVRMASDLGETSSFCVTREDPCEFETISLDDALMLNMCHGSSTAVSKASLRPAKIEPLLTEAGRREDPAGAVGEGTLSFLCPDLSSWREPAKGAAADGPPLSPSAGEAGPGTPELQEEPYDPPLSADPASPGFRTIDMEMLSTKFEMGDVCFYSMEEDHLGHAEESTLGFKSPAVPQGRGSKTKLDEGKQGKARGDSALKRKDKQYKCKVCFQWFLTLGELDFHKLSHNPSPPPTCYMCVQRKFSSREQLRDHLKEKHAKNKAGLWACGMCLKEISDVWMYNEHLREHATQFARKDQAQKSVLGLPGCFGEEDAAVTHFLNSIMCRKLSKSSKQPDAVGRGPPCKEGKSPKEPPGQDAKASKDPAESLPRAKPAAAFPKAPAVLSPDPAPKGEGAQRLAPMHPECKDPSRDCHHCGKQFPKPFKLQRHLVVHSLQKIYLCPKCPMFYQETKELRSHLGQEHGTAQEADVRHTTLYACELCADVMHVIKKSFICSTCNYTFSKKEQYDRHMEKHLVGSNKPFRFRGVLRPGAPAKDEDRKAKAEAPPREGPPAAKKKKLAHHHSWPAQGCAPPSPQLGVEPLLPPTEPLPTRPPAQASIKTEALAGDLSGLLAGMEKAPLDFLPLPPPPLAPQDRSSGPALRHMAALARGQPAQGDSLDESPPPCLDPPDAVSIDLTSSAHQQAAAAGRRLSPPLLPEKLRQAAAPEGVALLSRAERAAGTGGTPALQEEQGSLLPELSGAGLEAGKGKGSGPHLKGAASEDGAPKLRVAEAACQSSPPKDEAPSAALNPLAKEMPSEEATSGQAQPEDATRTHSPPGSTEDAQKPPSLKASAEPGAYPRDNRPSIGTRETGSSQVKSGSGQLRGEGAAAQATPSPPDVSKSQDRAVAKLHPKKRKEHKSAHKGSSASRENIEGDGGKKKKIRTPDPVRSDGAGGLRRADWPNGEALALSPRRRDAHCNRLTPKPKVPAAGGQLKKMVLDQCCQKKAELRHPNGDVRRKKDILGSKTFHPLLAKEPSPALPGSLHRHRTVQGAKLPECHNYRTAESQNNLLSQLFGQKLTSFKIPLRRDTSE